MKYMNKWMLSMLLIVTFSQGVLAENFSVDKSHSKVSFSIRHIFSNITGQFKEYSTSFVFDSKNPEASKGIFIVQAASVDTDDKKRDGHLQSPDFFDVKKYKTLKFTVTKVESSGLFSSNTYKMSGVLEIRGVKKDVVFDLVYAGKAKDPWGTMRASFTAKTKINRKDFGIVWNKTLDNGGLFIGEEVTIVLEIEAVQKK